ncbi:MAG: right-handed parallel beta-helix repeat-containing protein [Acidobacteria bacterium]|nr:right-handed parallel beta-helix repeat-containing protein [Acidobacteriota bacterium]
MPRRIALFLALALPLAAREFHVSPNGNDSNSGSASQPLKTISAAAQLAQPGDAITIHAGTYRERITPPRGGTSDAARITYQAAPGERPVIKGSELVQGWKPFAPQGWKATVPNSVFGAYNPYKDLINGDWFTSKGRPHHTGDVYLNGKSLWETHLLENVLHPKPDTVGRDPEGSTWTWFAEADDANTYIYANFHDKVPNRELVEINVRDAIFYPAAPGIDYITIRGLILRHAATQWAAPTAEQIGLIGTHMGKGWIIENNTISDSRCACISLGKDRKTGHNVWNNDPRKDGATHYNEVILRALANGWSKENTGGHLVRNNEISHCEQGGIVGSLGAVFSTITGNHIHHFWFKRQFTGAEMAGIKLHGAIDVTISRNRIHNTGRGLWMDWMAQGTRIDSNLLYDNDTEDLFVEVDHGPFVVANNVMLSPLNLNDMSQGGAYAHNLMAGRVLSRPEPTRSTPYHKPHSTTTAGLFSIAGGDDRFYNNLFAGNGPAPQSGTREDQNPLRYGGYGLWVYNHREYPLFTGGNVYLNGARPYAKESPAQNLPSANPNPLIVEEGERVYLRLSLPSGLDQAATRLVTTALLGQTKIAGLPFENADGSSLAINADFTGATRGPSPTPGPFEKPGSGELRLKVW